jgi:hypothetical protein
MRESKLIALLSAVLVIVAILMVPSAMGAQGSSGSGLSDTAVVMLSPSQEPNMTASAANSSGPQGMAIVTMNSSMVCYQLWLYNVSNVTQAHIHQGAPGTEGPVVAWLYPSNVRDQANADLNTTKLPGNFTGLVAKGNISSSELIGPMKGKSTSDLITAMKNGSLYINVHTVENPGGEIRGQINSSNIWTQSMAVPMTPIEEPQLNYTGSNWNISKLQSIRGQNNLTGLEGQDLKSTPWGVAVILPNGSMMHYAIYTFGITNVTQAHFHMGEKGAEGAVVAWMYPASDAKAPANVSKSQVGKVMNGKLTEGNDSAPDLMGPLKGKKIDDLKTALGNGSIYINVHTTQNPGGEIRGQVDPINMTCSQVSSSVMTSSPTPSPSRY